MIKRLLLIGLLLPSPALAETVPQAVEKLAACVTARDVPACRQRLTAASLPVFERFAAYKLMGCLPESAGYLAHSLKKPFALVDARISLSQEDYKTSLVFRREHGFWKLDLPETLRRGLGEQWEGRLGMVENLYLMMKSQLGDKLNCDSIRALGGNLSD